jgi:hypothetical protein
VTTESRRDIDQLAQRTGELAQSLSELRESIETVNLARREDIQVMVNIADTLSASIRDLRETQVVMMQQVNTERAAWQSEIQRIWEYCSQRDPTAGESKEARGERNTRGLQCRRLPSPAPTQLRVTAQGFTACGALCG